MPNDGACLTQENEPLRLLAEARFSCVPSGATQPSLCTHIAAQMICLSATDSLPAVLHKYGLNSVDVSLVLVCQLHSPCCQALPCNMGTARRLGV